MTTPRRPSERAIQAYEALQRSLDQKEQDIIDMEYHIETLQLMGVDTTELEQAMRDATIEFEQGRAALAAQIFRGREQSQ